jgi:hypothetical protein
MKDYSNFNIQKQILLEYMQVMITLQDWHGVADVAMDLRELEAKNKNYNDKEEVQWVPARNSN